MILEADQLVVEGESLTVVAWMQRSHDRAATCNPLVCDIQSLVRRCDLSYEIRHIYCEINSAADRVASFVAQYSSGVWNDVSLLSMFIQNILFSNFLGVV